MNNQAATIGTVGILDEFQTELVAAWRRLPNNGFFLILLAAWMALFQLLGNSILGYIKTPSLFAWMYEAYNSPDKAAADDGIGNFIPILVLALFWWKRNELLSGSLKVWSPALLVVLAGMALHILGYVVQEPHLSIVALFVGIYGLTGLAWGWSWLRRSFFPFFLFVFSVPLGNHSDIVTTRLRLLVCQLVEIVAHYGLGIDVIRMGTQLYNPSGTYQYEVAAACSGIRSLIAIFLLATVYGFVTFRSLWKRVLFMGLAFPFAVLGNLVRMLCIIVAAQIGGQHAGEWVHHNTWCSLIPYVPAIGGLLLAGRLLEKWLGVDRPLVEPRPIEETRPAEESRPQEERS